MGLKVIYLTAGTSQATIDYYSSINPPGTPIMIGTLCVALATGVNYNSSAAPAPVISQNDWPSQSTIRQDTPPPTMASVINTAPILNPANVAKTVDRGEILSPAQKQLLGIPPTPTIPPGTKVIPISAYGVADGAGNISTFTTTPKGDVSKQLLIDVTSTPTQHGDKVSIPLLLFAGIVFILYILFGRKK